eukprot:383207-Rhodomonas_salina.1
MLLTDLSTAMLSFESPNVLGYLRLSCPENPPSCEGIYNPMAILQSLIAILCYPGADQAHRVPIEACTGPI